MAKFDPVFKYILRRLSNANQPQIFGLPQIHRDLGVPRKPGGGSFVDNSFGNLRRAGQLNEVGTIGSGKYYVLKKSAVKLIKKNPMILRYWLSGSATKNFIL